MVRSKRDLCTRNRKITICLAASVVILSAVITFSIIDPTQIIAQKIMKLRPGSAMLDFMESSVEGISISLYLFNITNAERFLSGEDHKLKVKEVGPFTYRENRTNEDLELDWDRELARYTPGFQSKLWLEKSIGRPESFNVTVPNLAMLGIASMLSSSGFLVKTPFNLLATRVNSKPLVTLDAYKYIWGYEDPIVTLAHNAFPGIINLDKLGIMKALYHKTPNRLEVTTGSHNNFMIKSRNGVKKLLMNPGQSAEQCNKCDTFNNTYEGLALPCPVTPNTSINLYRTGFCKILDMEYAQKTRFETLEGLQFNLSDKFFSLNKSLPNDGLLDLSDCYFGLPFHLSKVNFLDTTPRCFDRMEGVQPDPKHNTYIIIEPVLGIVVDTYVPVQLNLVTKDLRYNSRAKPFSNMVIPIAYVEIKQGPLTEELLSGLYAFQVTIPIFFLTVRVVGVIVCVLLFSYVIILLSRRESEGYTYPTLVNNPNSILVDDIIVTIIEEPLMENVDNN